MRRGIRALHAPPSWITAWLAMTLALLTGGCADAPAAPAAPPPARPAGVLRLVQEAPRSLDPRDAASVYESLPVNQIFDTLVKLDPSLTVRPALAESWKISRDGLLFEFVLRSGVLFHDGSALVAADVLFTIERQLRSESGAEGLAYSYLMAIAGAREFAEGRAKTVAGLAAPDLRTVSIRLERPYPAFLEVLTMDTLAVVPRDRVRAAGDAGFARAPVGTGPFSLESWGASGLRLVAWNHHFAGAPGVAAIEVGFLGESESDFGAARFHDGRLDILEPPANALADHAADPAVHLMRIQELSLAFLGLNARRPPLDQPWLRQAIAHAIDRHALALDSPDVRREAHGILPPGITGYSPEPKALPYDPESARRLLAAAGYSEGVGLAPIPLLNPSSGDSALRLLEQIRGDLSDVGIRLDVQQVSWTELASALDDGNAPAFLLAWVADLADPDAFLRSLFETGGAGNYFGHESARTSELLAAGAREVRPVERARLYREMAFSSLAAR